MQRSTHHDDIFFSFYPNNRFNDVTQTVVDKVPQRIIPILPVSSIHHVNSPALSPEEEEGDASWREEGRKEGRKEPSNRGISMYRRGCNRQFLVRNPLRRALIADRAGVRRWLTMTSTIKYGGTRRGTWNRKTKPLRITPYRSQNVPSSP